MELKNLIKKVRQNVLYRTICSIIFSIFLTTCYVLYNSYLGLRFKDAFSIAISIYYFLLIWIKSATLIVENKILKNDNKTQSSIRIKNYKISSTLVFIVDFCLIAPIILMVTQPKDVAFGLIPAITMATYTVYKITTSIINYTKSKKSKNPTVILVKELSIIETIVSILNLQHILIMVNGGMDNSMKTLSLISSIGFIVLIVVFSIISFYRNKKLFQNENR